MSTSTESLSDQVNRRKARWLKRVMFESGASPTQKCVAFAIVDHLNCVTLDAWPSLARLKQLLGHKSVKTIKRALVGLIELGLITARRDLQLGKNCRYAPIFIPTDYDKKVSANGHACRSVADKDGLQSNLSILPIISSSTADTPSTDAGARHSKPFDRTKRGGYEVKLAEMFGADGFAILQRLDSIEDGLVERLCKAYAEGSFGEREMAAARLAARQVRQP